jgi:signal transduction histidine kinase
MKNIKIITNVKENTTIKADMNMLNAILRNLISNAIKFSNSGSTIEVNANKNHLGYIISVKDQGIGIPEELKDHIFSTTGKTSRKGTDGEDSTGLGLVLSKEYVLKHNGKIWFESKVNEGTTFYIEIPQ